MTHQKQALRSRQDQGPSKKTRRNRPSPWGVDARSKKLTAIYGPKPNWMKWKTYHSLAYNDPEKLKKAIRSSLELKAERELKKVVTKWPFGPKPDHIGKETYHAMARKAPWELSELIWKTNTGPAVLIPEQRVFRPTRKLNDEQKRLLANAYGILLNSPDNLDLYLKKLERIEPSLVGK